MRAAVYHSPGDIRIEERPSPTPSRGDLLLEVATVGICGTDAGEYAHAPLFMPVERPHPVTGKHGPTIPGHEFSGTVIAVGEGVTGFAAGDLVTCGAGVSCGTCPPCRSGRTNMCLSYWTVGLHADGALAEQVVAPASCCANLAGRSLTADVAALVQPMSIAVHATRRGRLSADDVVVVLGTGGIGTFITYAASRQGATVVAVDLDAERLAVAEAAGAVQVVVTDPDTDPAAALAGLGVAPSLVFECTATAPVLAAAIRMVSDNGRVVVVGHQPQPVTVDFKLVSFGEKEIIGTMAHVFSVDLPTAVDLLESGGEELERIAPTVHPLEDLVAAGILPMVERRQQQIKTLFSPALDAARPLRSR